MTKPVLSDPIALRIPVDVLAELEAIATATDRTRSWVMVRAIKHYLAAEGRDILAAAKGRDEAAAGKTVELDVLLDTLDAETRVRTQ